MRAWYFAVAAIGVAVGGMALLAEEKPQELVVPRFEDMSNPAKHDIPALRKKFAYESLVERLAYEADHVTQRVPLSRDSKASWERLKTMESSFAGGYFNRSTRAEALHALHSKEVEAFIKRNGFGLERRPHASPRDWYLSPATPIVLKKLPGAEDEASAGVELPPKDEAAYKNMRWPSVASLATYHTSGLTYHFFALNSFGHVKDVKNVAGFQGHHFSRAHELSVDSNNPVKERWALQRLELVSILKHDKPMIYVSEELPRMESLKKIKTRDLNDFETNGLTALTKGEDLTAEATTNRLLMFGSIRAVKQCVACHETVKEGDLLGAFSYELRRDPAIKEAK